MQSKDLIPSSFRISVEIDEYVDSIVVDELGHVTVMKLRTFRGKIFIISA